MARFLLAVALVVAALIPRGIYAASPIDNFPAIGTGGSTYPLLDPALTTGENLWMTQNGVDYKIDPLKLGYTFVGASAPTVPYQYQSWVDTSTSPVTLRRRVGLVWVAERLIDLTNHTSTSVDTLTAAHIFVGNSSNVATDVAVSGDLTLATSGAFTIANSAITTAKIADHAVTEIKMSGNVVFGPSTTVAGNAMTWNNTIGTRAADAGAPPQLHVNTNTALIALGGAAGVSVYRDGFLQQGDSPKVPYDWNIANCSSADNGAQVQPSVTGCWIANFQGLKPTPKIWGAIGNGTTDDTTAVQAAVDALANATLWLGNYLYKLTAAVTAASPIKVVGEDGNASVYTTRCPSGFVVRSDIDALKLEGSTGAVETTCFDMGINPGDRAAGRAVVIGKAATSTGHQLVSGITVLNPYDGIAVGAATTGASKQQTNGATVENSVVISPRSRGISVGLLSSGISTTGVKLDNNQIACFATIDSSGATNPNAIGIAYYDAAVDVSNRDVGPYGCDIGSLLSPGTANGTTQAVTGRFAGVVGDSSLSHDLKISPSNALGSVSYLRFPSAWVAANSTTDQPILIENKTGTANLVHGLTFDNLTAHGALNNTKALVKIDDDVYSVSINGGLICADGGGVDNIGVEIGSANVNNYIIQGVNFQGCNGFLAKGIKIPTGTVGSGIFIVKNNIFDGLTPTPIDWQPNGETAALKDNLAIDNVTPTIASNATTVIPLNSTAQISGVNTISLLGYVWSQRRITIIPTGAFSFDTTGNICAAYTATIGLAFDVQFSFANGCWVRIGG